MAILSRVLKCVAALALLVVLLGGILYFEMMVGRVAITNKSSTDCTDIEFTVVDKPLKKGDAKIGNTIHRYYWSDREGALTLSYHANGKQYVTSFGYISGPLGNSHRIAILSNADIEVLEGGHLIDSVVEFLLRKRIPEDTPEIVHMDESS